MDKQQRTPGRPRKRSSDAERMRAARAAKQRADEERRAGPAQDQGAGRLIVIIS